MDFSSISQAYTHLEVEFSIRGAVALTGVAAQLRLNNDSGGNYSGQLQNSQSTSVVASNSSSSTVISLGNMPAASDATATEFSVGKFEIEFYTDANRKIVRGQQICPPGASASGTSIWTFGFRWASNAAVNRITFLNASGNYLAGSRVIIRGIL